MTDPPAFLSFPEILGGGGGTDAGSSKAVPSFSSFPDVDLGEGSRSKASKDKARSSDDRERRGSRDVAGKKSRERSPERAGNRGDRERDRDRDRDRARDRERDRRRTDREREGEQRRGSHEHEREKARDKDRTRDRDERDRRRDRERKDRDRYREDDRDSDRRRRDDRDRDRRDRSRERGHGSRRDRDERAKEKEEQRARERRAAEALRSEQPVKNDDGAGWYEDSSKSRGGYEEPFDPTSAKVSFVDTAGDRDVIRYGATSSFDAPRYHRDFGGRVLGLSEGMRIVYSKDRSSKGLEIAPLGRIALPRYSARPLHGSSLSRIVLRPKTDGSDLTESFTPFDTAPRRVADDMPAYRAITKDDDGSDEEMLAIQASLGQVSTVEEDIKAQTVENERHLRANLTDIERWIKYSTLHLQLSPEASQSSAFVDPAKQPTTRANAEVTLSILARALEAHPDNFTSPELHIAYLRAAEVFWPSTKVAERWQNVLRGLASSRVPEENMMPLYLAYIEWREGQGFGQADEGGGVDEVVEVYTECLEKLKSGEDVVNHEAREENQVYLFLRACLFLKQAGYSERALAVFQALMEVTFFKPNHLRPPAPPFDRELWFTGVLQEFEDFWDSEAPRIGETGAKGWKETHASTEDAPIPTSESTAATISASDSYIRWLETERHAEKAYELPGRATDLDGPEDDPFHIILFGDVSPFLFPVQTPNARLQLIYAFFNFLGLPFTPPDVPTASASATDPHLRWTMTANESLRAAFWPQRPSRKRIAWQTVGGEPMEPEQARSAANPFTCPVKSWISDRGTLFAHNWFRDLDAMDLTHVNVDVARNVLTMLRPLVPDPTFVLATFAFEAALSSKAAVKVAKNVLSADRDNLALWDGYARLERQRSKVGAARQVYVTAIQAAEQHALRDGAQVEDLRLDQNELWAAWAEMEWEEGDGDRCLEVLVMAAGAQRGRLDGSADPNHQASTPPPVAMLKAKQHYVAVMSDSPSSLTLATLFVYLTDGIEAARDRLENLIASLPDGHPQAEETYQLLVKVIHIHCSRNPSPASLARDVLERAIAAFPNNTEFLSLYLWGETGGRVYGRIQRLVTDLTSDGHGIVALLWSVWAEATTAGRSFWEGGGAERVRRALDRGINTSTGKSSAALWVLYIEFETLTEKPASAKALCYRAIAAIGGCKDLYLLPFSPTLRPHFTSRELRAMAELMVERGIRTRVPTEAFWDDGDTEVEGDEDEDEHGAGGDYEYAMLRDREELKPY